MVINRNTLKVKATIALGAALSNALDGNEFTFFAVLMPAAWTSASLGIKVSYDGTTYLPLYDESGTLVQITPAVDKAYVLPAEVSVAHSFKLWSQNGSGTDTNQEAAREISVLMKA